jgi:hypothetical protein
MKKTGLMYDYGFDLVQPRRSRRIRLSRSALKTWLTVLVSLALVGAVGRYVVAAWLEPDPFTAAMDRP